MGPLTAIAVAAALLVARSVLWAWDTALPRVSHERARELAAQGRRGAALLQLKTNQEDAAATVRVGLTFTLVFIAALAAYAGSFMPLPPTAFFQTGRHFLGPAVGGLAVVLITTLTDLLSRAVGASSGERYALRIARPAVWWVKAISPLLRSVSGILEVALAPAGVKVTFAPPPLPLEEIERLLAEEAGKRVDQKAPALIHSIFELSEKSARDVMVPRTEIVAVDISTRPDEVIRVLSEEGHSRLPIFKDDVDHILGVLHTRDLVPLLSNPQLIVLQDLIRPATFVPWATKIGELLRDMQKKRIHMAMVVDEYGGFMGLVTLEDILREIVGEIGDEYGRDDVKDVEPLTDGSFLVAGSIALGEFNRAFSVEVPEGEYETLAGFLYSLAGTIPEAGDRFFFGGLQFTVSDRTPKQIRRVRVVRIKKPALPSERPSTSSGGQ